MIGNPINGKIVVRVSKEGVDEIFFRSIKKEDGSEAKICINVGADEDEDRLYTVFTQVSVVEAVGFGVSLIKKGDTAIIDYKVFNDPQTILSKEESGGDYFLIDPKTTYHESDNVVFGNETYWKQSLVWKQGEVDYPSPLLAVIRDGVFIPNDPYVFLVFQETGDIERILSNDIVERSIYAISEKSSEKYGIKSSDRVMIKDQDIFDVIVNGNKFLCCNDSDLLIKKTISNG